jgi:YesN/AraC family two-component response regulator
VTEALRRIATESFDVLITDLHMPGPGDGFTVVSAMRHSQPNALTMLVSGFTSDIVRPSFKLQPSLHIVQSRT